MKLGSRSNPILLLALVLCAGLLLFTIGLPGSSEGCGGGDEVTSTSDQVTASADCGDGVCSCAEVSQSACATSADGVLVFSTCSDCERATETASDRISCGNHVCEGAESPTSCVADCGGGCPGTATACGELKARAQLSPPGPGTWAPPTPPDRPDPRSAEPPRHNPGGVDGDRPPRFARAPAPPSGRPEGPAADSPPGGPAGPPPDAPADPGNADAFNY
ncbi:MAG: hypothetical protein HYV07_28465 [Deltaproteobacteria bacterium]|nr:hypothetical protein [Deltaproteobacteria bacterium]